MLKSVLAALAALVAIANSAKAETALTPAKARAVAKEAYVYGYPWSTTTGSTTPISNT